MKQNETPLIRELSSKEMSFGWSAGDILAAAKFILEVARALDEVDGAAQEFRTASSFLKNLNSALTPLEAFTALDTRPAYKSDIEHEVKAIRIPVEAFINDVKSLQKSLSVVKEGKFRHLQNIPSKLKWHFSTSKKALALQKEVEMHLTIIDTLMQRLTVDMLHTLETTPKADVGKSLEDKLNIHLPAFQNKLVAELSERNISNQTDWKEELKSMLEDLLERYLGPQTVILGLSSATTGEREFRKNLVDFPDSPRILGNLEARFQSDLLRHCSYPIVGITDDLEVTYKLQTWWTTPNSGCIWIQTSRDHDQKSLASDMIAMSYAAEVSFVAYFCQRITSDGIILTQMEHFIDLVYSLIYQLAFDSAGNRTEVGDASQWCALTGSKDSLPVVLEFLHILIAQKRGRLLIVIDSMDLVDNSNDRLLEQYMAMFFQILRNQEHQAIIKIILTTSNHSGMILDEVGWENTVDAGLSSSSDGFFPLDEFESGSRRINS